MKKIAIIWTASILVFILASVSHASLFKNTVPTGKEIKDPYLEKLFAPEFPYESVKVIETKEGKRYVVVKAKKRFSTEMEKEYQSKTLRQRNISIRRIYNPHTGVLMIAEIKLVRKVSDVPYVIEYCMADKSGNKDIAWRDGKYFVIFIDRDFGKKFKKFTLYPEKEADCPPPPHVGKYPDSLTLGCYKKESRIIFTYVTRDEPQKIYDFYKDRLKKHFDEIGFWGPESSWKFNSGFGMRIDYLGIEVIDEIISKIKEKTLPSPRGVVFEISITRVASDAERLAQGYSFVKVFYETDQSKIKENIRQQNELRR